MRLSDFCLTALNQEAKDALEEHSKQMLHRFEQLEAQTAGLQESNDALVQQVLCSPHSLSLCSGRPGRNITAALDPR